MKYVRESAAASINLTPWIDKLLGAFNNPALVAETAGSGTLSVVRQVAAGDWTIQFAHGGAIRIWVSGSTGITVANLLGSNAATNTWSACYPASGTSVVWNSTMSAGSYCIMALYDDLFVMSGGTSATSDAGFCLAWAKDRSPEIDGVNTTDTHAFYGNTFTEVQSKSYVRDGSDVSKVGTGVASVGILQAPSTVSIRKNGAQRLIPGIFFVSSTDGQIDTLDRKFLKWPIALLSGDSVVMDDGSTYRPVMLGQTNGYAALCRVE